MHGFFPQIKQGHLPEEIRDLFPFLLTKTFGFAKLTLKWDERQSAPRWPFVFHTI